MKGFIHQLLRDEGGATAIEYGLICALIGMVVLAALGAFSGRMEAVYGKVSQFVLVAGG
ncbi:Flp family type IVb pilin [Brevundimonas guildfordensis]|uniref:Flp family type IVb pilin n=1 Tax=Brevundimonas guildfordensis TaxID=2762241 RepID=A0ABR8R120_9CAUL|nr:Flp family type IVb pilin [Brevundimonas guildfordensis]MBD7941463.1 Flp family type IVb pilin [Brevundimonas guildfordensis]